jgi:acetyl esterase/lipase
MFTLSRMNRRDLLLGAAAAFAVPRAAAAQSPVATESFGPAELDIYRADGFNLPVIFFVHGGAWRFGSRAIVRLKPGFFRREGYIFVSTDYRLVPNATVEMQADDVSDAYRWVQENIAGYGGDPSRIVAVGHSAGAHLIALTGLSGRLPGVQGLFLNDTEVYDLPAMADAYGGKLPWVYESIFGKGSRWSALSPANYINRPEQPAVMVSWSSMGRGYEAGQDFSQRLIAAGVRTDIFDGRAYSHLTINRRMGMAGEPITLATKRFLDSLEFLASGVATPTTVFTNG